MGVAVRDPDGGEPAEATLFDLYVDSLRDDVAPLYRGRAPELGEVLVDAVEPEDTERAAAAIEEMAAASPEDPVLRLERARWRLARGEAAAAREDLEVAWAAFGDEPLDLGGHLSIPVLWCEVAMAQGDHAAVLERLEARGELTLAHPDLSGFYATALLAAGESDEARRFLAESLEHFPRRPEIAYLLAGILLHDGEAPAAIALLERSLRVCGAGCAPRDLHAPSLRLLAAALAGTGGSAPSETVERLADVLLLLRGAQGGELGEPGDWMLQARCHELAGETAAAERARARAGATRRRPAAGLRPPRRCRPLRRRSPRDRRGAPPPRPRGRPLVPPRRRDRRGAVRRLLRARGGGGARDHRPVGIGQEHAAPPDRHARPADRGTIEIDGTDPFGLSEPELAWFRNRTIGFVFQDSSPAAAVHGAGERAGADAGVPGRNGAAGARARPRAAGPGRPRRTG